MKLTVAVVLSLAAGFAAGWFSLRPATSAPAPASSERTADAPSPDEPPAIEAQIAAVEAARAPKPIEAQDPKAKAAALLARLPALRDSHDRQALYALLQELAALGEPGFPGAMEIAVLLGPEEGSPLFLGDNDPRFAEVFTPGLMAFADWVLHHPEGAPAWLARFSMRGLSRSYDLDPAPGFLAYIAHGTDPANLETAVHWVRGLEVPSLAPAIADAVRGVAKNPEYAWELLESLSRVRADVALPQFEALAASTDPLVAALGARALAAARPPPERVAVTFNGDTTSFEQPYGLGWGDVVVSLDSTTLTSVDHLKELYAKAPDGTPQILTIERDGKLMRIKVTHHKGGGSIEPLLPSGKTAMEEWNEKQESEE